MESAATTAEARDAVPILYSRIRHTPACGSDFPYLIRRRDRKSKRFFHRLKSVPHYGPFDHLCVLSVVTCDVHSATGTASPKKSGSLRESLSEPPGGIHD